MKPLILYFTANYPSKSVLLNFLQNVDSEIVKYVEIGIPTRNPLYDGPSIKRTHSRALETYSKEDLNEYVEILQQKGIPTYILAYYNVLSEYGNKFIDFLGDLGIAGVIVPDLLTDYPEKYIEVVENLQKRIDFIPFFNPATPDSIINDVAARTQSWVYYGLQPSTGISIPYDLKEVAKRIVTLLRDREVNFGFGIRTKEQVMEIIALGSNGAAIGSMLVKMLDDDDLEGFLAFQRKLREAMVSAK